MKAQPLHSTARNVGFQHLKTIHETYGGDRMKRLIFITGSPRTGKTTVLLKAAEQLSVRGYKLGGMISGEISEKGVRVGFEVRDYTSNKRGWLAHVCQPVGPRIGKYRVNLDDLNLIGVTAILNALKNADIVLIDEIGPMELFSESFRDAVQKAVNSSKPVLGTIHYRAQHNIIKQIKSRKDADVIEVTQETRAKLLISIVNKIIKFMQQGLYEG